MIVGIDLGAAGALALMEKDGDLVAAADMPVLADGPKCRPAVNAALLAAMLQEWQPEEAFVEFVGSRPTDGHVGAFAFGRARGVVEGVLGSLGVPLAWMCVPTWRRAVGLPPGATKDQARGEAIRRWPRHAKMFARVKDDGRAEAALVAVAGIIRGRRP